MVIALESPTLLWATFVLWLLTFPASVFAAYALKRGLNRLLARWLVMHHRQHSEFAAQLDPESATIDSKTSTEKSSLAEASSNRHHGMTVRRRQMALAVWAAVALPLDAAVCIALLYNRIYWDYRYYAHVYTFHFAAQCGFVLFWSSRPMLSAIKVLRHTIAALGYNEELQESSMPPDTDFYLSILDGVWLPMCVAHWAMNGREFWHYQSGFGWFPIACFWFTAQGAVWAVFLLQSLLHIVVATIAFAFGFAGEKTKKV